MEYTAAKPFHGNIDKSLDLAVAALSALGFRLDSRTSDSAKLSGPGMNSSKQSPLVGASRLDIRAERGQLALSAELGGVERLSRFVRYFPLSLTLGLGIVLLAVFGLTMGHRAPFAMWAGPVIGVTLLNGALWTILGPWMARKIHERTCQGLETLLASLVTAGEAEQAPQ